jgi:S-adenosylmethionine synthetase
MPAESIWITGATGLLGRALFHEFSVNFPGKTIGSGFSRAKEPIKKLDLLDSTAVQNFVNEQAPRFILHSAAERRPDISEEDPEFTNKLNIETTRQLAELAQANDSWIFYISTDYVFDGTTPPYQAGDFTNPLNHYGKSKLEGENVIREITDNFAILRVPILYGPVEDLSESAVTSIALTLQQDPIPAQDHWAIRYPTHVDDVATVCRQMAEYKTIEEGFRGVFHWSGNEPFTKYSIACAMASALDIDPTNIPLNPKPTSGTPRPQDCCLDTFELDSLGFGSQRDFQQAITKILLNSCQYSHDP